MAAFTYILGRKGKNHGGNRSGCSCSWRRQTRGFLYFDKGEDLNDEYYSERNILRSIAEVDIFTFGLLRVKDDGSFRYNITQEDIDEAQKDCRYCGS